VSRFTVRVADLDRKPHNACFLDFASALADALRALGHEVVPPGDPEPGRLILLGANDADSPVDAPPDAILYNTEQVAVSVVPFRLISRVDRVVWDYSMANVQLLRSFSVRAVHCPVGYVPSMTTIDPKVSEFDVLFYGWMNNRRKDILDALTRAKLKVVALCGVYGKERDAFIARSKIVLNLHYHERSIFEIFRVSHLLANKKCVVTEGGGEDEELEAFAKRSCFYVPRPARASNVGEIVSACLLCCVSGHRETVDLAARGHEAFKRLDLVESVRRALAASDVATAAATV
jgi:hypothetical protein